MSGEEYVEGKEHNSYSYMIWYNFIWYLIQYSIILALHFRRVNKLDQPLLQVAVRDTLLLNLVFLSFQWAKWMVGNGIFRVPHVIFHMFADLIPTIIWLMLALLFFLISLGVAQQLYHHIRDTKVNLASLKSQLTYGYFKSLATAQPRVEGIVRSHAVKYFPKLVEKYEQPELDSLALRLLFLSAFLLIQLSTVALVMVHSFYEAGISWLVVS